VYSNLGAIRAKIVIVTFPSTLNIQLGFHRWATERMLEQVLAIPAEQLVKNLKSSFGSVYDTIVHLYQSDRIWLDRLEEKPAGKHADYEAPGCTWELRDAWLPVIDRMVAFSQNLNTDADANRIVEYKNLAGQPFASPVWQMIFHVVNHGTYHRGQITTMIRQLGYTAKSTDLIQYYRSLATFEPMEAGTTK
jgi:uncharacterized damage-inducible protein DinB